MGMAGIVIDSVGDVATVVVIGVLRNGWAGWLAGLAGGMDGWKQG